MTLFEVIYEREDGDIMCATIRAHNEDHARDIFDIDHIEMIAEIREVTAH